MKLSVDFDFTSVFEGTCTLQEYMSNAGRVVDEEIKKHGVDNLAKLQISSWGVLSETEPWTTYHRCSIMLEFVDEEENE